jgi:hypothetical protein
MAEIAPYTVVDCIMSERGAKAMRSCDTHLDLFLLCNSMTAEYLSLCCAVTLYFLWSEFHKSINGVPVRPSTS